MPDREKIKMAVNVTVLNQVLLDETGPSNIPAQYWWMLIIIAFVFFILSIYFDKNNDITSAISAITFVTVTVLTPFVEFVSVGFVSSSVADTDYVYVASAAYHPYVPYIAIFFGMMFIIAVLNVWRIHLIHLDEAATRKQKAMREGRGY